MKRRRVLLLLSAVASGIACSTQDIVVATLEDDGGPRGDGTCLSNADCKDGEFCEKPAGCAANARGGCQRPPIYCDDTYNPSCGCDGVTYWNDCWRQQNGISVDFLMGECIVAAATCTDPMGADCPVQYASCAKLLINERCDQNVPGTCWFLPYDCPDAGPSATWTDCTPPGACDDTCNAIRSGTPHLQRHSATCP